MSLLSAVLLSYIWKHPWKIEEPGKCRVMFVSLHSSFIVLEAMFIQAYFGDMFEFMSRINNQKNICIYKSAPHPHSEIRHLMDMQNGQSNIH